MRLSLASTLGAIHEALDDDDAGARGTSADRGASAGAGSDGVGGGAICGGADSPLSTPRQHVVTEASPAASPGGPPPPLSPAETVRVRASLEPGSPWVHAPDLWQECDSTSATPACPHGASGPRAPPLIERHHVDAALKATRPSISANELAQRETVFRAFEGAPAAETRPLGLAPQLLADRSMVGGRAVHM